MAGRPQAGRQARRRDRHRRNLDATRPLHCRSRGIADRVSADGQWARPVEGYSDPITEGAQWLLAHLPFYVQWYRFNMFWRYGDGLLPFLRKDPAWPHPDRAVNKGNDRHREELTDFVLSELRIART